MLFATSIPRYAPIGDMALRFDGVDDVATAPTPDRWVGSGSFSVAFWMFPNIKAGCAMGVIGVGVGNTPQVVWLIDANGQLNCTYAGVTNALDLAFYKNQWIFVTTVFDATALKLSTMFNGGALQATNSVPSAVAKQVGTVTFGSTGTSGTGFFYGALGRVGIWSAALTAQQIEKAMIANPVGWVSVGDDPPPSAIWRMNEGYGSMAFDYASPKGKDAMLGQAGSPNSEPEWMVADLSVPGPEDSQIQVIVSEKS
jgi:hypothetical protein